MNQDNRPGVSVPTVDTEQVRSVLLNIQQNLARRDDDQDQNYLVEALQEHRTMLLNYATLTYLNRPKDPKLLEAVTGLVAQIEKAVRDDRKERLKKKENEDNKLSFNQMMEAMKQISAGEIVIPKFEMTHFLLDPSKSLLELNNEIKPIKPEELDQGNTLVDLDGNVM